MAPMLRAFTETAIVSFAVRASGHVATTSRAQLRFTLMVGTVVVVLVVVVVVVVAVAATTIAVPKRIEARTVAVPGTIQRCMKSG
jgi:hypothetical protein